MIYKDDEFVDGDNRQQTENNTEPNAYRADDGAGLDEGDLKKAYLFGKGDFEPHPTEGQGTGGQKFGEENLTPAGNDKNNPSQLAGSTNAYFDRKEPSEEHPEDSNFTAKEQDGAPNYSKAESSQPNTDPKPEEVKRGNGENDRPHPQQPYTEGTDDNDGTDGDEIEKEERETNIPGPNELPDQLKVGE